MGLLAINVFILVENIYILQNVYVCIFLQISTSKINELFR